MSRHQISFLYWGNMDRMLSTSEADYFFFGKIGQRKKKVMPQVREIMLKQNKVTEMSSHGIIFCFF